MLTNTVSARRTRNITTASELFASSENDRYEAWFHLYLDFVDSGIKSPATYAVGIAGNPFITTKLPSAQTEKVLGAIRRAVAKYGTINKVKVAHAKWAKENGYEYVDISNFKLFAPAGQRAKNVKKDAKQALYETVSLNRADAVKRLMAGGMKRAEANNVATLLGIK